MSRSLDGVPTRPPCRRTELDVARCDTMHPRLILFLLSARFDPHVPLKMASVANSIVFLAIGFCIGSLSTNIANFHTPSKVTDDGAVMDVLYGQNHGNTKSTSTLDFFEIGKKTGTDKVAANFWMPGCLKDPSTCTRKNCTRLACRPWGHYYNTLYQQRLSKFSTERIQFLEVGFFYGKGFDTYSEFLPEAELHSMEISCLPNGTIEEGGWPWGNFAKENKKYQALRDENRLHCGDASSITFLKDTWTTHMKRPDAPPLKVVVDDGSHISHQMAASVFFWFPRIAPGGYLIVEDIQPIYDANKFRTQFLPQIMNDLHFCGDPTEPKDDPCFPTLYTFLQSIHCEMHICIFERNDRPAEEPSLEASSVPEGALDLKTCKSLAESFGRLE